MDVMNIVADAQSYELDTSGSTIPYPSRGDFVVTLSNSATGAVQASRVFSWVKVGTLLKAEDPNALSLKNPLQAPRAVCDSGTWLKDGHSIARIQARKNAIQRSS
ncbi:hypothetical protein, partial [Xanthomonas vasicola]|uniref:hypothetical protein n=1 Tax=Xanthomonas vasicola TaxID=56459 RepID=UPI0016496881